MAVHLIFKQAYIVNQKTALSCLCPQCSVHPAQHFATLWWIILCQTFQCVCHSSLELDRAVCSASLGMSGELLCCETYTMLKNPCSEKYLLIKGGRYRAYFRDIMDIEICILLLQRTSHQGCCEGSLGSLSLTENTSKPDMWKASCLISSKLLMLKEVFFFCLIKQHHDCCDNNSF